ncbi:MAG: hypothetical protein KYX69_00370 [Sphingomonas sp.]|uniref:surface-adhesin E family protein n=1 Tax=Sphingomonas sp. TaxID=28214 RepID=UPI0026242FCF|nr:surface-adhesin E family protein [Sphingomonas sp.]MDK2766146.1 hypothetical protein [Sphingomonas sp.]
MKRLSTPAALICLAFAGTSLALAADWELASFSKDGTIWYVDRSSIRDVKEGFPATTVKKAWIKADYSAVKTQLAREAKILAFFKCDDELAKTTVWIMYKADGTVLRDISPSFPSYTPVIPETNFRAIFDRVCYPESEYIDNESIM